VGPTSRETAGPVRNIALNDTVGGHETPPVAHGKGQDGLGALIDGFGFAAGLNEQSGLGELLLLLLLLIRVWLGVTEGRAGADFGFAFLDQKGQVKDIFDGLCKGLGIDEKWNGVNLDRLFGALLILRSDGSLESNGLGVGGLAAFLEFLLDDLQCLIVRGQGIGIGGCRSVFRSYFDGGFGDRPVALRDGAGGGNDGAVQGTGRKVYPRGQGVETETGLNPQDAPVKVGRARFLGGCRTLLREFVYETERVVAGYLYHAIDLEYVLIGNKVDVIGVEDGFSCKSHAIEEYVVVVSGLVESTPGIVGHGVALRELFMQVTLGTAQLATLDVRETGIAKDAGAFVRCRFRQRDGVVTAFVRRLWCRRLWCRWTRRTPSRRTDCHDYRRDEERWKRLWNERE
jgi:hypothetical protein